MTPQTAHRRGPTTFESLRNPQFRLLWIGLATSTMGGNIQQFALGWLVVQLAVREGAPQLAPFYIGLTGLARAVPALAFSLLGGVFADRMDRRLLLMYSRVGGALVALALAALVIADVVTLAAVLVLTLLSALTESVDLPTRTAMVARILPEDALMSAQGLTNTTYSSAQIFGPLVGGVLIGPLGLGGLMIVKAAAYVVAVVALFGVDRMPPDPDRPRSSVIRSLGEGLAYVYSDPVLRWVTAMSIVVGLFGRTVSQMLPAVAQNTLNVGPTELSWLLAMSGAGALIGSFLAASLGGIHRRGLLLAGSMVVWGALIALFAAQRSLVPALLLVGVPSIPWFVFAVVSQVVFQIRPPDHIRGRATSLYAFTASGVSSIGLLVLGALGSALDVNTALQIGGGVMIAFGAFVWLRVDALRREGAPAGAAAPLAREG